MCGSRRIIAISPEGQTGVWCTGMVEGSCPWVGTVHQDMKDLPCAEVGGTPTIEKLYELVGRDITATWIDGMWETVSEWDGTIGRVAIRK